MKTLGRVAILAVAILAGIAIGWAVFTFEPKSPVEREAVVSQGPTASAEAEACLADPSRKALTPRVNLQPVLRVELGEHIGAIRALAVSKSGKMLVTGGWDKTVRIWTLVDVDGSALRQPKLRDTLNVPVGAGRTGEAYAVALSPDEAFAAVGGRMANEDAPDGERVYVFDVSTARLVAVLPIAQAVSALSYSADGRLLAAGAKAGDVGLCVWSTDTWRLAGHDRAYGGEVGGLAFAADGSLSTSSEDGSVRVYARDYSKLAAKFEFPSSDIGHDPKSVSFSPNGKLIAVGYYDAPFVSLHDAALQTHTKLMPAAGSDPDLRYPFVNWSSDGKTVFGGGSSVDVPGSPRSQTVFQAWRVDQDQAISEQFSASAKIVALTGVSDQIQALRANANGGAVFVTRNGDIFGAGGDGQVAFVRTPTRLDWRVADWTASAKDFRVSRDGKRVSLQLYDGRYVRFDLERRNRSGEPFVTTGQGDVQGLAAPSLRLVEKTISLTNPEAPTIEGAGQEAVDLWLGKGERAASFAADDSAQAFAVGTNHKIHLFDGENPASVDVPETAQRISVTTDGRLIVAAIGDGTLRWYKIIKDENRERRELIELLAVYLHSDGRRWVAWTPAGYYDAAAGAEELINWQVNRGTENGGLAFSVGRFRDLYWRSDVIDKALIESKAGPDPSVFLAKSPPVIRINGWQQMENKKLRVSYDVEWLPQSKQKIADVVGMVDGTSQPAGGRGFEAVENRQVVYLDVPPGTGRRIVQLRARTVDSQDSDPAILELPSLKASPVTERNLYAVIVGVSKYRPGSGIKDLDYADDDARVFADLLSAQAGAGKLYNKVFVNRVAGKLLIDDAATRDNIRTELKSLAAGPNDVAVLFLAGHGTVETLGDDAREAQTSLFLPNDAKVENGHIVPKSAISVREIADLFFNEKNRARKLIFVDACRSGNFARNNANLLANALKDNRSDVALWSAATAEQLAYESRDYLGGHGAFTASLIEAFNGKQEFQRILQEPDRFTESELSLWLERRVPEIVGPDAAGEERQTPVKLLAGVKKEIAVIVP